jgi:cytosine/adenosine deaminase-related metal-dependent hydrolase
MADALHPDRLRAGELLLVPDRVLLPDGPAEGLAVVVLGAKFGAVGPAEQLGRKRADLTPVRMPGRLLMPGFVDTHHHLTQSFGKALAFGEPSEIYRRIWVPLEKFLDDELIYLAAKLAALESLRGGFTTVCDAGTRADAGAGAVARATRDAGLRCVLGLICNDKAGPGADRNAILRAAEAHLAGGDELMHPSLAVSLPEVASDEMLRAVAALCREAGAIFQTHVNEHLAAVERSLVERKMRPLEVLHHAGALGPHALLAHCTLVTPSELALLRDTDTAVAYNPVASAWKGNAVAPANLMASLGIRFGLGTDATRSDAFRLMDAAETAQRLAFGLATGDSSSGAGWTWLDHATRDGANAAGLRGITGEIAAGCAADFLIVDIDIPEMQPSFDLGWELVRYGNRDQIDAVFVAGKLRLWQGWPLEWDARPLLAQVAASAHDIVRRAPIQRIHEVSRKHRAHAPRRAG